MATAKAVGLAAKQTLFKSTSITLQVVDPLLQFIWKALYKRG